MKTLLLITLAAFSGGFAQAGQSWKVESKKEIYFAPDARVSVRLTEVKESDQVWGWLSIELAYKSEEAQAEANNLKKENPGYLVGRAILGKAGNYRLRIPSLGIDEEVATSPGNEGPYFSYDLFLTRKQTEMVQKALAAPASFLMVEGNLLITVPEETVVERAELPAGICRELTVNGSDVYGVTLAFPAVEKKILAAAREEVNQDSLRAQILRSCLELDRSKWVYSFADLLKMKLRENNPSGSFVSEVRRTVQAEKTIPLTYQVSSR